MQDYVKFARAKGLTNGRVIGVHVLRNILIPIVTVIGLEFGSVIAFAIVTESVFAWPRQWASCSSTRSISSTGR
jgi:peptide/nickel transport system permease protein